MDGCNGCFKDNYGGWMVSEMDGCNGRFKDYSGWMKSQKNKKMVALLYLRWIDGE